MPERRPSYLECYRPAQKMRANEKPKKKTGDDKRERITFYFQKIKSS